MNSRNPGFRFVLIGIFACLIFLPVFFLKVKFPLYPYQVAKDYEYAFDKTRASVIDLKITNGKVVLPAIADGGIRSAFLKVNVEATLLGKYLQPSLALGAGKRSSMEYFEHGVKGLRYINLTPFLANESVEIALKGGHVSIDDQNAQLVLFNNLDIKQRRILVLASHPDDAEIAAYGLYSGNKDAYIVTVTSGDAGNSKYGELFHDRTKDYLTKGKIRTWNSITVPMLGGVSPEQSLNLGYFDSTLKAMFSDKSFVAGSMFTGMSDINVYRKQNVSSLTRGLAGKSDWNSLVQNFIYLLEQIKPEIIVTPYPKLDSHPDHKLTSLALFEAIKKMKMKDGYLYLYSNHYALNEFYPYGNAGGAMSLPPNFDKSLFFTSIYSHPLSLDAQNDKVLALDAMSDLRPGLEWRSVKGAIYRLMANVYKEVSGRDYSYYRRAIRSNELFFVVNIDQLNDQNVNLLSN